VVDTIESAGAFVTTFSELEKQIFQALKDAKANDLAHSAATSLQQKALKLAQKGRHEKSAAAYGALATLVQDDLDLPLRTAHCYQKAKSDEDAARWLIQAAERYARQNHPTQAIASLRLYHALKPDDHNATKRIYRLCRAQREDRGSLLKSLSDKTRTGRKLHACDLFSLFDDHVFDALLGKIKFHHHADKEVIDRMGDEASSLYFVIRGEVEGYLIYNNNRTYLGSIGEDDVCGETAYFTGGRRTTETVANSVTELLELPYELLDSLKQDSPVLNDHLESLYRSRMLVKQLALTPPFKEVDAKTRQKIAAKMKLIQVKAGQTLFKEGDTSLDLYLVRTGKVAVNLTINGSEKLLKTVETGGVIGDVSIAAERERTATARTISDCTLMILTASNYSDLYQHSPQLQKTLHKRKQIQIVETLDMIKGVNMVEGDDACKLLLKDIWQE